MKPKLKIAVAVHGRFHAFDLAKAVLAKGHDVTIFTNYPRWAVARFGLPPERVRSFWIHGVTARLAERLNRVTDAFDPEPRLHMAFGRWLASELSKEQWDVVHGFSSVSEEHLREPAIAGLRLLVRGSAHIRTQQTILQAERDRTGWPVEQPSPWVIAREEREYDLADRIVVLSTFAHDSFVQQGFDESKLKILPLGVNTQAFRPTPEVVEDRCTRILAGARLRVLYVGGLSFRKGLLDTVTILRTLGDELDFRFVGPIVDQDETALAEIRRRGQLVGKRPHNELPKEYAWGDVFLFPTVEDGFAVVLAQANAAALPILTTPNCCGPDLIDNGRTGWVLPIRNPEAFVERLLWCDTHRVELAEAVRQTYYHFQPRTWSDVASDFEDTCVEALALKRWFANAAHGR